MRNSVPFFLLFLVLCSVPFSAARGQDGLTLNELIDEALRNSPEILAAQARAQAAGYRIPQAKSLPDPMFMFGYQNEGFRSITIGQEPQAMGMFSVSQQFFFPGKRDLKGEMATRDAESLGAAYRAARLRVVSRVKEAFYDLFLAYKTVDILKENSGLYSRIEDAAVARYSSGMGSQQEVVMTQTEKYMLLEKEEMQKQKIQALQGMLNSVVGRRIDAPLGRPAESAPTPFDGTIEQLLEHMKVTSPEIRAREKMVEGADAKVRMAKREYYPDVSLNAGYFPKINGLLDMWNLTATVNIPLYYRTKQNQAIFEADAGLLEAKRELLATEYMLSSTIKENHSMVRAAERLMALYREGLMPKVRQDVQLALSGYVSGKTEAITVISRMKNLLEYELLYWIRFAEREKAIARLHAVTGTEQPMEEGLRKEGGWKREEGSKQ